MLSRLLPLSAGVIGLATAELTAYCDSPSLLPMSDLLLNSLFMTHKRFWSGIYCRWLPPTPPIGPLLEQSSERRKSNGFLGFTAWEMQSQIISSSASVKKIHCLEGDGGLEAPAQISISIWPLACHNLPITCLCKGFNVCSCLGNLTTEL